MTTERIDVKENKLLEMDGRILDILLKDRTTGRNIIWATDTYAHLGEGYAFHDQITPALITGENGEIIQPRVNKTKEVRQSRVRNKAEVFTPSWICNKQINLVDDAWFGRTQTFNSEVEKTWATNPDPIEFPAASGKTWQDYVKDNRLEITCGEAPYIVSRYDAVTGTPIAIKDRIGMLDRKLRVVDENTLHEKEWVYWAKWAVRATYGYEWQGDSLLLARENVLYTFIDYYANRFCKKPSVTLLLQVAKIIAWNIWQMDGLKCVTPDSCRQREQAEGVVCPGCAKRDVFRHIGRYCYIYDWGEGKKIKFTSLIKKQS